MDSSNIELGAVSHIHPHNPNYDYDNSNPNPAFYGAGSDNLDDDGRPRRTGTIWTASAHIVTAVIGSGVLSLAWSMAKLGWIAGPIALLAFAIITYFTSLLLADCYRSPTTSLGQLSSKRNYTYMDAVRSNLGEAQTKLCAIAQYGNFVGIAIGYTITASISMVAITRSNCFHENGHNVPCFYSTYPYMILFGFFQVILSQIPSFSKLSWLSMVAAIMSFSYSTIGIALGVGKAFEKGHSHGTLGGLLESNNGASTERMNDIWSMFQALGNIAFAYSYSMILIEIQDTIKSPPDENKTMKKANLIGVSTTTTFYMLCGCIGYAAFGNQAPGNLLTGFGYYEPYWLVDLANACVVVHLVGAFQVFCQPLFAFVESYCFLNFPKNPLISKVYKASIPFNESKFHINMFVLIWRTAFVVFTTLVAMLLPFFNDILGIIGALSFWPLTVYFPIQMYISKSQTPRWSYRWITLQGITLICLLVSLVALIGSMQSVVQDLKLYKPFNTHP